MVVEVLNIQIGFNCAGRFVDLFYVNEEIKEMRGYDVGLYTDSPRF